MTIKSGFSTSRQELQSIRSIELARRGQLQVPWIRAILIRWVSCGSTSTIPWRLYARHAGKGISVTMTALSSGCIRVQNVRDYVTGCSGIHQAGIALISEVIRSANVWMPSLPRSGMLGLYYSLSEEAARLEYPSRYRSSFRPLKHRSAATTARVKLCRERPRARTYERQRIIRPRLATSERCSFLALSLGYVTSRLSIKGEYEN
jgi:hypothetical protein